jgi:hypothetical protein
MYFLDDLSYRYTANHYLSFLQIVKISYLVPIWNWIQKYKPQKLKKKKKKKDIFVYKKMKLHKSRL